MSTVLSIDLDYWEKVDWRMLSFLEKVKSLRVPTKISAQHHSLLKWFNSNPAHRLVNIDYHSDLSDDGEYDKRPPVLNCGTWANHIKWSSGAKYIWVCPNLKACYRDGHGRCDDPHTRRDPFRKDVTKWKSVKLREGLSRLDLSDVKAVGIAVSPFYLKWNFWRNFDGNKGTKKMYLKLSEVLHFPVTWLWIYYNDQDTPSKTITLSKKWKMR